MTSLRRVATFLIASQLASAGVASIAQAQARTGQTGSTGAQNNQDEGDDEEEETPPQHSAAPTSTSATTSATTQPSSTTTAPATTEVGYDFPQTETEVQGEERRTRMLPRYNNLSGAIGLLHMDTAEAGSDQTFRVAFTGEYFTQGAWLRPLDMVNYPQSQSMDPTVCMNDFRRCPDNIRHIGATLGLSYSPERHFDIHLALRSYATSYDTSLPHLFQVLGDTTLGVKAIYPILRGWNVGADISAVFLNRTGDIGLLGQSTSADFRLLTSWDLQQFAPSVPIRIHLNASYFLDNGSTLVNDVESARMMAYPTWNPTDCAGPPTEDGTSPWARNLACHQLITREERYALGINRADRFNIGIGVDAHVPYVNPFIEWNIGIPVVRNGFVCLNVSAGAGDDDHCLKTSDQFAASPSNLTIGARVLPPIRGLMAMIAFDIATGGNGLFVRELAPNPPWMFYFGLGFANDFAPQIRRIEVPHEVVREHLVDNTPIHGRLAGTVTDADSHQPIAGAVIDLVGHGDLGYVASGPQGHYHTHWIPPGEYEVHVRAVEYNDNTCRGTIPAPTGTAREVPDVTVDCALRPLPRVGNIAGRVTNSLGGAGVGGLTITLTPVTVAQPPGASGAPPGPQTATSTPDGGFQFQNVLQGTYTVAAGQGPTTMAGQARSVEVQARQTAQADLTVNPVGRQIPVTRTGLNVTEQIHFQTDQTEILPDSNTLLERIADVIQRHPEISCLEIQGHTDNQGSLPHNMQLSQGRAESVRTRLISLGVAAERLNAHGYGPTRPIAPNLTAAGRARNRRVMFVRNNSCGGAPAAGGAAAPEGGATHRTGGVNVAP
jgi:outer membrane protein OmpA-like peptidoglycan-associated protein